MITRARLFGLLLLAGLPSACNCGAPPTEPPPSPSVWRETTVAFDPECTDCPTLVSGEYGHVGEVRIAVDEDADDPIAQWGDCLESFRACVMGGEAAGACSQRSACPESCRTDFEGRIVGVTDLRSQITAFEAVYVNEGAPCLPPVDGTVQP